MNVEELRIGQPILMNGFEMRIVALFEEGDMYLDFEGNEGDVWEANVEDDNLELKE